MLSCYSCQNNSLSRVERVRLCLEPGRFDISCTCLLSASDQSIGCNEVKSCLLFRRLSSLDPFAISVLPKLSDLSALVYKLFPAKECLSAELLERGVDRSIVTACERLLS